MQYSLNVPGFENRRLAVQEGGLFSGAKLLIDGQSARKGPKRGHFILRRNDGSEVTAKFVVKNYIDPIPQIEIEGKVYIVASPLKWYQWLWSGLPLVMIFGGGFIGGIIGAMALVVNGRVFRSNRSNGKKYGITGLVSATAVGFFLVAVTLLNIAVNRFFPEEPKVFTSVNGGFSILTPYTLAESKQTANTQAGQIELFTFAAEKNGQYISITYSDYPPELIRTNGTELSLSRTRDGFISSVKGQLLSEKQISLDGFPGRDILLVGIADNKKELSIHARYYLVNNRLFQIVAITQKGKDMNDSVTEFFQSFKILAKK